MYGRRHSLVKQEVIHAVWIDHVEEMLKLSNQFALRDMRRLAPVFALLCACHHAEVDTMPTPAGRDLSAVHALWFAPSDGVMGDALSIALARYGFSIIDRTTETSFVMRSGASEAELIQPQALAGLRQSGIDAIVFVRSVSAYDGAPQSATVRVVSTSDGVLLGGVTWQNAAVGKFRRTDLRGAASQIGESVAKEFGRVH